MVLPGFPPQSVPSRGDAVAFSQETEVFVTNLRSAAMSNREDGFWLPENASKARVKEATDARKNRLEIVAAHSQGKVSRRDLGQAGSA